MEELTQDGGQLARTMLMATAQLAESMARVQAQRAWMAQNRSVTQVEQARAQIAAERDAARLIFRPLTEDGYWQAAPQLDRVVQAYMTATSWADHDPEAQVALELIKQHSEARWGRDVTDCVLAAHIDETVVEAGLASVAPSGERQTWGGQTSAQGARLKSAPGVAQPIRSSLRNLRMPAKEPSRAGSQPMLLGKDRKVDPTVPTRLSHGR